MSNNGVTSDESPTQPVPILNACLSYVRHNMIHRDKLYILDSTLSRFDLSSIKVAHEVLSKSCDPTLRYSYRGPKKASQREKAIHALDEIFHILVNLDAQRLTPCIACPSEELNKLLVMNGPCDHKMLEDRFQSLESQVSQIKSMENTMDDLKRTVLALMTNKASSDVPTAIPPVVKERIQSEIIIVDKQPDMQLKAKGRSFSVSSKRGRSDDEEESDIDTEFLEPKYNVRKQEKRQKRSPDNKIFSKLVSNGAPKFTPQRRLANWGKAVVATSPSVIPDLFVFNCSGKPDENVVKSYLEGKGINVLSVLMKSPPNSVKRSFKVSVASHDDHDKLSSGEILPVGVGVKKYLHTRRPLVQAWTVPSVPSVSSSAAVNADQNKNINEFLHLSDSEKSALTSGRTNMDDCPLIASAATVSKNIKDTNVNSSVCHNG